MFEIAGVSEEVAREALRLRSHTTSQHVIVKRVGICVSKSLLSLCDRIDGSKVCLWCFNFWLANGDITCWFDEQVSLHLVGEFI